jgi:hypothetical protein
MYEPIAALNWIPLRECGEPLVDLRVHCAKVRIGRKCLPYLRQPAAEMLNAAQARLPAGHRFRVTTALRTLETQRILYERYLESLRAAHLE